MDPFLSYLLVGAVIALLGLFGIRNGSREQGRCTVTADAVIVEVLSEKDDAGSENTHKKFLYTPIYEFTAGGMVVRRSGGIYSRDKKAFKPGDRAVVRYNPADPEEFLVEGKSGGKRFGIALLLFGLLIMAIAFTQR